MVSEPDWWLDNFVAAGCEAVIIYAEVCPHLHRTLGAIRERGARAGVALNPSMSLAAVDHVCWSCSTCCSS